MAQQDVITFKPERIKVVYDKKTHEVLYDPNHMPIIKALRKGSMTVREIEEAYAEEAAHSDEIEAKSDKTIYRYLKVLEKANLVVPAGQRVVIGKTATETLFSRTAEVFISGQTEYKHWNEEKGKKMAKQMAQMLSQLYEDRKIDQNCFLKFLKEYEISGGKQITNLVEGADEDMIDIISSIDWGYKEKILNLVSVFAVILNDPEIFQKLRDCFS